MASFWKANMLWMWQFLVTEPIVGQLFDMILLNLMNDKLDLILLSEDVRQWAIEMHVAM